MKPTSKLSPCLMPRAQIKLGPCFDAQPHFNGQLFNEIYKWKTKR